MLSGPAGGVVGYATTSYQQDTKKPVIGFDMGGNSTLILAVRLLNKTFEQQTTPNFPKQNIYPSNS